MALIKCEECGSEISDKAAACPKCGAPNRLFATASSKPATATKPKTRPWAWIALGVIAILVIAAISSPSHEGKKEANAGRTSAPPAPTIPPIEITATQLLREYQANEVAADLKYKGKPLAVTGAVKSIDKDLFDAPYLSLSTGNDFAAVQAKFPKEAASELAKVQKGQSWRLTCTGGGMILQSPIINCQ